jgi:GT2 family glycosyltransferase
MSVPFSIVVVTHNSADELGRLIASLQRHLPRSPQLVVVDTGSRDESVEVGRRAGADVVALGHQTGFGAANNIGVQRARSAVTALLNPDVELQDEHIVRLVERARDQQALFVPRLVGSDSEVQESAHPVPGRFEAFGSALLGPALPPRLRVRAQPWRSERGRPVGWAIAAALVARTDLLRTLGPFDPNAFLFYEDLDLCLRARERGFPTVLDPQVVLRHRGGHSTTQAYGGEPFALLAQRRREVVGNRLGRRALALDDLAQGITFASRAAARLLGGRPAARPRAQLQALLRARREAR